MTEGDEGASDAPRRRGRPSGAKSTFSFRIAPALRAQLEESAAEANRTLSEEVETRLEQSFWAEAAKAHEKEEFDRFSADAYLKRVVAICGGEQGFDFALMLGDHMKLVRLKHRLAPDVDLMSLPEEQRLELARDFASALPGRFGLWNLAWGDSGQRSFDVLTGSGRVKINSPKTAD